MSTVPAPAFVPVSKIAVSVVNASVETDMRSPVPFVENECLSFPSPIAGSPEKPWLRSQHPGARHPVIIVVVIVVGPVAGSPNVIFAGTKGLFINRQGRRAECNRYTDLREGCARRKNNDCERKRANETSDHFVLSFSFGYC